MGGDMAACAAQRVFSKNVRDGHLQNTGNKWELLVGATLIK